MNFSSRVKVYVARTANLLILALFMCVAVEVKAQWTTPDGSGNTTTTGTGNVGVSNPTPRYKLDILGSANNAQIRFGMDSSDSGGFLFSIQPAHATFAAGASWSNFGWTARAMNASSVTADSGYLHFYTNTSLTPGNAFTPTARMSINPFGSVGIGTTNPGSKLHVVSGTDTSTSMLSLDTGVHGGTQMWVYGTANNESGMEMAVYRAGVYTTRFAVNSFGNIQLQPAGGNVGIGASNPAYPLEVVANTQWVARFKKTDNTNGGIVIDSNTGFNPNLALAVNGTTKWYMNSNASNSDTLQFWESTGTQPRFTLTQAGTLGLGTPTPNSAYKIDVQGGTINASGGLCIAGVCKTDWSQVGGGTSQWLNGTFSSINYAAGNVGIGTATPSQKLEVSGAALINTIYGSSASSGVLSLQSTSHTTKGTIQIGVDQTTTTSIGQSGTAGNKLLVATDRLIVNNAGVRVNGATDHGDLSVTKINITNTDALQFRTTTPNIQSNGSLLFTAQNVGGDNVKFNVQNSTISNAFVVDTNGATPAKLMDLRNLGSSKFAVDGSGNVTIAGNINAKYQDVAEWVDSSQELSPGTVVVLDASKSNQVIAATQSYDSRVAGVISLRPGITLGEASEGRVLVATTGRVKVKVDATNGPIQIGDLLVTSDREGFAMKSTPVDLGGVKMHRPGTLIGKALESLDKGTGEILVLLSLQ